MNLSERLTRVYLARPSLTRHPLTRAPLTRRHPLTLALTAYLLMSANAVFASSPIPELPIGDKIFNRAVWAFQHVSRVKYAHNKAYPQDQIEEWVSTGDWVARTDDSGFASWVLHDVSPDRLFAVEAMKPGEQIPDAKTFARFFASLSPEKPNNGWLGIQNISELQRGDFIAWSGSKAKGDEGHVMVVAQAPSAPQETTIDGRTVRFVNVRVIDSSPVSHFPPEHLPPMAGQKRRDGIGEGYIRLIVDADGKPIEHWDGLAAPDGSSELKPAASAIISFGRVVGEQTFTNVAKLKMSDLNYDQKKKAKWVGRLHSGERQF